MRKSKKLIIVPIVLGSALSAGLGIGVVSSHSQQGSAVADLGTETVFVDTQGRTLDEVTEGLIQHVGFEFPTLRGLPDDLALIEADAFLGPTSMAPRFTVANLRFGLESSETRRVVLQASFVGGDFIPNEPTSVPVHLGDPAVAVFLDPTVRDGFSYHAKHDGGGVILMGRGVALSSTELQNILRETLVP